MTNFANRVSGAVRLDPAIYEEVEADTGATSQALTVVLVASVAGGVGLLDPRDPDALTLAMHTAGALIGWVSWAWLTYAIGTRMLPESQTRADAGELLRTLGFASAPGVLRVLGLVPRVGLMIYAAASILMLMAMIVAVRQALDYRSTGRAVGVCLIGWALSLALAVAIGILFPRTVL